MPGTFRTRFAPSPTGPPHLGMLRTALFAFLAARRNGGEFVLRVDDTDPARSKKEWEKEILAALKYLGIEWDEGPDVGGAHGPYRQSERVERYSAAIERLKAEGFLYPCFCSEAELNVQRAAARAAGRPYVYDGRCRKLDSAERSGRLDRGKGHVWRFHVDSDRLGESVVFQDLVWGEQSFRTDLIGDFVCVRGDGKPTYMLVSPLDDATMAISHVIRGADHIPNTPSQILLLKALGWEAPQLAHLPLLLSRGGKKLSKREALTGLDEIRRWLPEALVNHLALLGWTHPEGKEVLLRRELEEAFDFQRVSTSPAAHDPSRLAHLEREQLALMSPDEILQGWRNSAHAGGIEWDDDQSDAAGRILSVVRDEIVSLEAVGSEVISLAVAPSEREIAEAFGDTDPGEAVVPLDALLGSCAGSWMDVLERLAAERGKRRVYMPVRVALTGKRSGFELSKLFRAFTDEEAIRRLKTARDVLASRLE